MSALQVDESNVEKVVEGLRESFFSGITLPEEFRLGQLKTLKKMMVDNKTEIIAAVQKDLGKGLPFEVLMSEWNMPMNELEEAISHLHKWMKPTSVSTPLGAQPASSATYPEPKGVVLLVSPWNYPVNLAIVPLIGAICGGNTAFVKLSRHSRNTGLLLERLLTECMDPRAFRFESNGGASMITKLITFKWDHILFTGSCSVGKLIYQAAAKHMTPVTLELGGKNPCIVDEDTDLSLAARRITWGKFFNCGQTCVGVDHILVHHKVADQLVEEIKKCIVQFYGEEPKDSPSYGRIISKDHAVRLTKLFKDGDVVHGGTSNPDTLYVAPTIITNPKQGSLLMEDEIFGPVLAVQTINSTEEAIQILRNKPLPLALYVFTRNGDLAEKVINNTRSGAAIVNDVIVHFVNTNLPFGGVGESGLGAYHGKLTFETFVHRKAVMKSTKYNALDIPLRYPPYTDNSTWLVDKVTRSGL
eukprot:TRINITY_DN2306_c0_g1_i1.p1 TRINITY_DN2306_c0_g1~~TRINITY_DN2306_c0_g1_i1.p1  ORF type:complete len:472 (-),score=191.24 TRINITY_DN2306_c0_g1_i1:196-1611(-)